MNSSLLTLKRYGTANTKVNMDDLTYQYDRVDPSDHNKCIKSKC